MGIMDFVKSAGRAIGIGSAEAAPQADVLKKELDDHGLKADGLDVKVEGDKVTVSGRAMTQEEKEKIVLAVGNVQGVATVDDQIQTGSPGTESTFYTVKKGDTLSAISKAQYGESNKYQQIFEANKPMLKDPDKIYPGQVLRIPPEA